MGFEPMYDKSRFVRYNPSAVHGKESLVGHNPSRPSCHIRETGLRQESFVRMLYTVIVGRPTSPAI